MHVDDQAAQLRAVRRAHHDAGELVTAQAADDVVHADGACQARGHDADNALVEVRVEHDHGGRWRLVFVEHGFGQFQGLFAHLAFDGFALAVDAVERAREFVGALCIVGDQAFDAQGHIGQASGCIEAWAESETHVETGGARGLSCGNGKQRAKACV